MGAVLQFSMALEQLTCASCGVAFAMPGHLLDQKREHRGEAFCPNGHVNVWKKSEADRLREQLAEETRKREEAERAARWEAERASSNYRAMQLAKAKAKKLERRTSHGVCPVDGCKRTVKQLARHIASKHPDFAGEAAKGE